MINENEQWNLSGDCNKCRRQKYCNTHCKAHKRTEKDEVERLILSEFAKTRAGRLMGTVARVIMEKEKSRKKK